MTMLNLSSRLMFVLAMLCLGASTLAAQPTQKRIGLVIGNGDYKSGSLPTAANDAGLIAQTLQAAGFDVIGARDLEGDAMRQTFRDFVEKVAAAGPDAVVFVYLGGHGLQLEGENYFVPVDAQITRDLDVPIQALRISDYLRPLGAQGGKAVIVVLDTARDNPFAKSGQPLAGGLALVEPTPGMLVAFNAAPGTIAPEAEPPYGVYAQALAEMIREGGLPVATVFDRVRLRVNDLTGGAVIPWHASKIETPLEFFERAPDAPVTEASYIVASARAERPIRDFSAEEAYHAALERDTLRGYLEFLDAYADHPLAKRVRGIVAARREAITWRRSREADTPEAYWSYLDRYPNGPHAHDARRRLAYLTAPFDPPPRYVAFDYGLPPPPREEFFFIERRVVFFGDPFFAFAPPPPPPIFFLPPPPPRFFFPAPAPSIGLYILPAPVFVAVPLYVRAPAYVAPPPNNVVFNNIHNTTVINNFAGPAPGAPAPVPGPAAPGAPPVAAIVAGPNGAPAAVPPTRPGTGIVAATAVAAGAAAAAVALPPALAKRAATQPVSTLPAGAPPGAAARNGLAATPPIGPASVLNPGQALPGAARGGTLPTPSGLAIPPASQTGKVPASVAQPRLPNAQPQGSAMPQTGEAPGLLPKRGATSQGASLPNPSATPGTPPSASGNGTAPSQQRRPNTQPPATATPQNGQSPGFLPNRAPSSQRATLPGAPAAGISPPPAAGNNLAPTQPRLLNSPPSPGRAQVPPGQGSGKSIGQGQGPPLGGGSQNPGAGPGPAYSGPSRVPGPQPGQQRSGSSLQQSPAQATNRAPPGKAPAPLAKDAKKCGIQGTPPCK